MRDGVRSNNSGMIAGIDAARRRGIDVVFIISSSSSVDFFVGRGGASCAGKRENKKQPNLAKNRLSMSH
jgi:hypothetical protein